MKKTNIPYWRKTDTNKYSWWLHKLGQLVALAGIQISCGCRLTITFFIKSTRRLGWYNLIWFIKCWVLGDQILQFLKTTFSLIVKCHWEIEGKNFNSCFWENLEHNWDWLGKGDSKQNVCLVWLGGVNIYWRLDV